MNNNTNLTINVTLSAVEMAAIREALRYAAEQVHDSDIPVFENYETMNAAGKYVFDEDLHTYNQAKADLALELADTLDLIEADSYDWKVFREDYCIGERSMEVWCRHWKTGDFATPLVVEFLWKTPVGGIYTSILKDYVMPVNTTVAVHSVPYSQLTDKNVVHYYTLDEIKNKVPNISEDREVNDTILSALRSFLSYGVTVAQVQHKMCMIIVATYVTDKGTIYASADGTCWINEVGDLCMNLATGECIEVLSSETDEEGNVNKLYYQA